MGGGRETATDSSSELLSLELLVTPRSDLLDGGGRSVLLRNSNSRNPSVSPSVFI